MKDSMAGPPLRAIVVGIGVRGRAWVECIQASSDFALAGCVDHHPETLAQIATAFGVPQDRCETDAARAFDRWPCDAVVVSTPADDHPATCELALAAGKAVLVEKPFTMRLADAVRLVRLAEEAKRPLLVAHNYRHMRAFRTVRRLIGEGAIGRLNRMHLHYHRVPHAIVPSLARLPHVVLWGMGVHHLDLMRHVTGEVVTDVMADAFDAPGRGGHGASLQVMLSCASGARGLYAATYESSGHEYFERGQEFYARLAGDRATLHVVHRWLVLCENGKLPRVVRRGRRSVTEETILLDRLARALRGEDAADSSGRENLQTMAVVEACVRSSAERCRLDPQELLRAAGA